MSAITVERIGRRSYLRGNTYPCKDLLRDAGAKWDPDQRAWWIGNDAKAREVAEKCGGTAGASSEGQQGATLRADDKIAGKARYKGREYLLVWEGETKRGFAAKLAFVDGSKIFWADRSEYEVTKRYQAREYRGRAEHMTFGRLQRLREEFAAERQQERDLGAKDGLVGERSELGAQFEGGRGDRTPGRKVGESCWLKHRGQRIAVVVVGYELASYLSRDYLEDMDEFGMEPGWYGTVYYRRATLEEATALQARPAGRRGDAGAPAGRRRVVSTGYDPDGDTVERVYAALVQGRGVEIFSTKTMHDHRTRGVAFTLLPVSDEPEGTVPRVRQLVRM